MPDFRIDDPPTLHVYSGSFINQDLRSLTAVITQPGDTAEKSALRSHSGGNVRQRAYSQNESAADRI